MRYSLGAVLHSLSLALVLATTVLIANAWSPSSFQTRSNPITVQLYTDTDTAHSKLSIRSPANNATFGAGLTGVSLSKNQISYYIVIKAGNISLRVALDTGSSDLWIVASSCESVTCTKVPRYPLSYESPTFMVVNDNTTTFVAQYADTTFASGFVAVETIQVAGLTLASQVFALINNSNVSLADHTSGIMGLGFPRISYISNSTPHSLPFFANLAQKALLEYPIFALSLSNSTGSLTLGAIDSSVVTNVSQVGWNEVAEFPPFSEENNVSSYLQWAIVLTSFSVNGTEFTPLPTYTNSSNNQSLALFDVGASGIYGPFQDVSRLYANITDARLVDASGQWAVPCSSSIPLAFTFGEKTYTLKPTDYIIGQVAGNPDFCLTWPIALPPSSDGIDWQMGTTFLRTVYTIFSFGIDGKEPPLIGLYQLNNASNPTETPGDVSSYLSVNSATVATTLPNFVLPTPTYSTPPLTFNTSVPASIGGIVLSGLANSTYTALFGTQTTLANVSSAFSTIDNTRQVITLFVTNSGGVVATSVSTVASASVTLGVPPGWQNAARSSRHIADVHVVPLLVVVIVHFFWTFLQFSWTDI